MKRIAHTILFLFYFSISSFAQNDEKIVDTNQINIVVCRETPIDIYVDGIKLPDSLILSTRR
jgi:hypothetical protein